VFEPGVVAVPGLGRSGVDVRAAGSLTEGCDGLAALPEALAPGVGVRSNALPVGLPVLPGGALGWPTERLTEALGSDPGGRGVSELVPCAKPAAGAASIATAMARAAMRRFSI
jgi:hypothetical protein